MDINRIGYEIDWLPFIEEDEKPPSSSALLIAAETGDLDELYRLLSTDTPPSEGSHYLKAAVKANKRDAVHFLLCQVNFDFENLIPTLEFTFHKPKRSEQEANLEIVKLLLDELFLFTSTDEQKSVLVGYLKLAMGQSRALVAELLSHPGVASNEQIVSTLLDHSNEQGYTFSAQRLREKRALL